MSPAFLKTPDAAAYLGLSPRTLEKWRGAGKGPRYSRLGRSRSVVYAVVDLDDFARARLVGGGA